MALTISDNSIRQLAARLRGRLILPGDDGYDTSGDVYVNHLAYDDEERVRAAYGPNYDRLVALKDRFDPTNFFRMNHNVRPSA